MTFFKIFILKNHGQQQLQVITIAPYTGKKENHLSFNVNEIINVREQRDAWWSGELNGKIGWFPQSYVRILDKTENSNNGNGNGAHDVARSVVDSSKYSC